MNIAGRELGAGHPCFIVAEISANHNGSLDRALALIHAAKQAGADAVKFQAFTLDEILALRGEGQAPPPWDAYTKRALYTKALTPAGWFPELFATARRLGLIPFASVFGAESLAMLESLDCPVYKIAKAERKCAWLLEAVYDTGKPMLISCPRVGDVYRGRRPNISMVYCPGGYPCRGNDLFPDYFPLAESHIGCSLHYPEPLLGPIAVARGAHYLEFHLTLDDGVPTLDDCVNLTASQFQEMVRLTRKAEAML